VILTELLKENGLTSALIVDDAYDDIPLANDLVMNEDGWSIFFADIGSQLDDVIKTFPSYNDMDANQLRSSDDFVRAMWEAKEKFSEPLWNALFESYERDRKSDRDFLENLKARLIAAGLEVKSAGRVISDEASECNIIFADLFLGAAQQDFDVDKSIERIKLLTNGRESAPPAVVLMSRSPLLGDKKEKFRDDAEMLGALFRVYRKMDLLEGAAVETVLERFAIHYADAVRVAAFVVAWQKALGEAVKGFIKPIRRLDLSDYTKIREVLLDVEGQPLGSYMLDIFDRVLQYEIEGHQPTINAALELNNIDPEKYPTPYIAGSPDLQDFVMRSLWQNPERLKVASNTSGMPVSFGDVFIRKSKLVSPQEGALDDEPDVLVVLTAACDLARDEKRRVLLVGGVLNILNNKTWKYETSKITAPIVQLSNQPPMAITWNLDDQRMLKRNELEDILGVEGPYKIALRLRESNAIELQQRMLASMGRIGLVSKMPFTFPVEIIVYTADVAGKSKSLELPITSKDGGVCISGRDSKGDDVTRLILTEASVDEILRAIPMVEEAHIHERARDTLKRLKLSLSFRSMLQRGIKVPAANGKLAELKTLVEKTQAEEEDREEIVGLIARNLPEVDPLTSNNLKSSALIIILKDIDPHPGKLDVPVEQVGLEADTSAL
jgi:hypothetical protein